MTHEFCGGIPPQRCPDPGGWPQGWDLSAACCQTGPGVGWPQDGHGEIVGYRGPLPKPVPLGVRVRTSPQCGSCPNENWPARSQASDGTWNNGDGAARKALLQALETLPAGTQWPNRPVNPDLCRVSPGLIQKFDTMNKPPIANARPAQLIEATSPNGAVVVLNGSGIKRSGQRIAQLCLDMAFGQRVWCRPGHILRSRCQAQLAEGSDNGQVQLVANCRHMLAAESKSQRLKAKCERPDSRESRAGAL